MLADDLYRFDLEGYLVLPGAVRRTLLDELAPAVDRIQERLGVAPAAPGQAPHERRFEPIVLADPRFLDAVLCPAVLPLLPRLVALPRLRSTWLDFKAKGMGIAPHSHHTPFDPRDVYLFCDGRICASTVAICVALADVPADGAALEVIPGSHKANLPLTTDRRTLAAVRRRLPLRAGDVLLFSHDLNHGSFNERDYVRRTLWATIASGCAVNRQGGNDLHRPLFDAAPEGSWRKYLLRDAGPFDTYPQPSHAPETEVEAGPVPDGSPA